MTLCRLAMLILLTLIPIPKTRLMLLMETVLLMFYQTRPIPIPMLLALVLMVQLIPITLLLPNITMQTLHRARVIRLPTSPMAVQRNLARILVDRIVKQRDPEGAVEYMLRQYPDHKASARAIYSMWTRVRKILLDEELVCNDHYLPRLQNLIDEAVYEEDRIKLTKLLSCSLADQHKVTISSAPFLLDEEMDDWLKCLEPCDIIFHSFQLPTEIANERFRQERSRAKLNQEHRLKAKSAYKITESELDEMFNVAADVVRFAPDITSTKKYYEVVVALQLVSGRRNYEIMSSLEYHPGPPPFEYQATVAGICKKSIDELVEGSQEEYVIPLTVEYRLFKVAMDEVRKFKSLRGMSPTEVNSSYGASVLAASGRLFGRRLTHSQKRNLYVEKAYKMRTINQFCVGDQSCSKHRWAARALCHVSVRAPDVTQRYQTMIVE